MKETLALPKEVIDERFGVRGREGVDIEIIGCTGGVNGGGFVYTNLDTVAVGVVLKLPKLGRPEARARRRSSPTMKRHSAIAPLVEGGELKEYSAHLIPEAGLAMMPEMTGNGLLVAGDAAALCLAAGIWLEGVNFAMASGMYAGEAAIEAIADGDVSQRGLGRLRSAGSATRSCCATTASCGGLPSWCSAIACSTCIRRWSPASPSGCSASTTRQPSPGCGASFAKSASAPASTGATSLRDGRDAFRSFG